jgi:hypothetical protein
VPARPKLGVAKGVREQSWAAWALKRGATPQAGNRAGKNPRSQLWVENGRAGCRVWSANTFTQHKYFYNYYMHSHAFLDTFETNYHYNHHQLEHIYNFIRQKIDFLLLGSQGIGKTRLVQDIINILPHNVKKININAV